jgi:hypothetical protein
MKKIGKEIKFQQKILFFICSIVALFFPGFTVVIIAKAIKDAINEISLNENLLLQQFIEELK